MGSGSTNGANSCATCRCAAWCEKYRRARIGHTLSAAARAYADSRTQPRPFQPPIERGLRDEASSAATLAPADQTSRPRPCQRRCADAGTCGSVKLNAGSGAGPLSIRVRPSSLSSVTVTAVQRAQGTVPGKRTRLILELCGHSGQMTSACPDRCFASGQSGPLSIRPCHGVCWAPRKRPARLRAT